MAIRGSENASERESKPRERIFFLKIGILEFIYRLGEGVDGKRIRDAEMDILIEKGPKGRWKEAIGGLSLPVRQKESTVG